MLGPPGRTLEGNDTADPLLHELGEKRERQKRRYDGWLCIMTTLNSLVMMTLARESIARISVQGGPCPTNFLYSSLGRANFVAVASCEVPETMTCTWWCAGVSVPRTSELAGPHGPEPSTMHNLPFCSCSAFRIRPWCSQQPRHDTSHPTTKEARGAPLRLGITGLDRDIGCVSKSSLPFNKYLETLARRRSFVH